MYGKKSARFIKILGAFIYSHEFFYHVLKRTVKSITMTVGMVVRLALIGLKF